MKPIQIEIYSRPKCHLCDDARQAMERVGARLRHIAIVYKVTDVDQDPGLRAQYGAEIPVVLMNGAEAFRHRVDEREFERKLKELWKKSTS